MIFYYATFVQKLGYGERNRKVPIITDRFNFHIDVGRHQFLDYIIVDLLTSFLDDICFLSYLSSCYLITIEEQVRYSLLNYDGLISCF